jgi:hypothetical protein
MDSTHRKAIPNTIGLLVYDSTYKAFYFNNGTIWQPIASSAGLLPPGNKPGDILYWNGSTYAVLPVGQNDQSLRICNGQLTWATACPVVNPIPDPITLTTSPLNINFDGVGAALPAGVFAVTGASPVALGLVAAYVSAQNYHWATTTSGPKSYASATGLTASADSAAQSVAANRVFGFRQSGTVGDPGAAFVFEFANTTGKTALKLDFLLQSLDITSPREVTWAVDYGFGDVPVVFTPATATGTLTTGNLSFTSNPVAVDFGSALNNKAGKVWVRIVALAPSTGIGARPTVGIDNVKFTWL